jgi:hypothetical protein
MSGCLKGVGGNIAAEMIPVTGAADVSTSGNNPTTNNSRWSKICDWAEAHQKEIIIAGIIIGIALICFGVGLFAGAAIAAGSTFGTALISSATGKAVIWGSILTGVGLGLAPICGGMYLEFSKMEKRMQHDTK